MSTSSTPTQANKNTPDLRISLSQNGSTDRTTLSRREKALPIRTEMDIYISHGKTIEIDCTDTDATQSFMDELIGILVLERGPSILSQIQFRGCSDDMKAIIKFVVNDRAAQHIKNPHFHAPR